MPYGCDPTKALLQLRKRYVGQSVNLKKGESWTFRKAGDLGFLMQKEIIEIRKLSQAAIEILTIIAFHQPTTRAETEELRGVSVSRCTIDQLTAL